MIQRRQEQDLRFFLPLVSDLTEGQFHLLLFLQTTVVRHAAGAVPPLLDLEVAEAAGALAATLETAGKGIIYEHHATSMPAQRLAAEFRRALAELMADAGAAQRSVERDVALAARRLEQGAKTAAKALPADEPPVYLRLLGRLMSQRESHQGPDDALESPASPGSRLIIPG